MGGDFNCHHQSWESDKACPARNKLSISIQTSNLLILNYGSSTLFTCPNQSKCAIDFFLVSGNLSPLGSRKVENDEMGSDYFPISTTIGISCSYHELFSQKYNFKKSCLKIFFRKLLRILYLILINIMVILPQLFKHTINYLIQ